MHHIVIIVFIVIIAMFGFVLFHDTTHYTSFSLSHIHVNTTYKSRKHGKKEPQSFPIAVLLTTLI
jgi:hypothetical protein